MSLRETQGYFMVTLTGKICHLGGLDYKKHIEK